MMAFIEIAYKIWIPRLINIIRMIQVWPFHFLWRAITRFLYLFPKSWRKVWFKLSFDWLDKICGSQSLIIEKKLALRRKTLLHTAITLLFILKLLSLKPADNSSTVSSVRTLVRFLMHLPLLVNCKAMPFSARVNRGETNISWVVDFVNLAAQDNCWFEFIWIEIVRAAMIPPTARSTAKVTPIIVTNLLLFLGSSAVVATKVFFPLYLYSIE